MENISEEFESSRYRDKYEFQKISFSTKELTFKNKKIAKGKVQLKGGKIFVKAPFLKFKHIIKVTRLISHFSGLRPEFIGTKIDLDIKEDVGFSIKTNNIHERSYFEFTIYE